jgi:lipopolysaccharide biosynthesis glycosyltransferase
VRSPDRSIGATRGLGQTAPTTVQPPPEAHDLAERLVHALTDDLDVAERHWSPGELVARVNADHADATLVAGLIRGDGLETALVRTVSAQTRSGRSPEAWALAAAVAELGHPQAAAVAQGLVECIREWYPKAWETWAVLADAVLATSVPVEVTRTLLLLIAKSDSPEQRRLLEQRLLAVDAQVPSEHPAAVEVAGMLVTNRYQAAGAAILDRVVAADPPLPTSTRRALDVLIEALNPAAPRVRADAVVIGVLDYAQPDQSRASTNVGDYIQTLAMLGHVGRFSGVTFDGDPELVRVATEVQARVPTQLRKSDPTGPVHLLPVHRDFSHAQAIPPNTWMVAFGWHMHSLYGVRFDFPYHPNIQPIFVSFHVNRPALLTDEAVDYLRRHGPVGCRDWSTVYLLRSAGVEAFFTGCLTTTVDGALGPGPTATQPRLAMVDPTPRSLRTRTGPYEHVTHRDPAIREVNLAQGVEAAVTTLESYRAQYTSIVTSRLHCYLPATALGIEVEFEPQRRSDIRFEGLLDLHPQSPRFRRMQAGLRDVLEPVLSAIIAGADAESVRAIWRERTAGLAQRAAEHQQRPLPALTSDVTVAESAAAIRAQRRHLGPAASSSAVSVALALDRHLLDQLPVTLHTMLSNTSGALHLWILTRGMPHGYVDWLGRRFSEVPITLLPCDGVDYGEVRRMIKHITVSTMDRLLLPRLLPDVDRCVYVDIDALVLDDVRRLVEVDLAGTPLAARTFIYPWHFMVARTAAALPQQRAAEFRRRASLTHPFDFRTLNAGILVMDLARMRADQFTESALGWVERYGLNDQDALLYYVGPNRAELEPRWNAWPVMEPLDRPSIVHFVGSGKPWGRLSVPAQDLWRTWAARTAAAGEPPPTHQDLPGSGS